ncbi:hypothetical protein CSA80_03870 [Candidatus Saccharibacteria bacterium]|nr:MAG: hypothetical protein CSA80_03870 [Candidatus Saccharibacteria bacterium]
MQDKQKQKSSSKQTVGLSPKNRETNTKTIKKPMTKHKPTVLAYFAHAPSLTGFRGFVASVFVFFLLVVLSLTRLGAYVGTFLGQGSDAVYAATSDNLNFQARLETSAGAIAPDGYYNVEFKLYDASASTGSGQGSCAGDTACLWVETRTGANTVRVVNGYLTVNLGDVTSFPADMPWDQQLYLTMNVGGAGSPVWDGEMNPRLKLTAVPYAFNAKTASSLTTSDSGNTATLSIDAPTSGDQTFVLQDQGAPGTYNVLTDGNAATLLAGDFIQNQNTAAQTTADFWIDGAGRADTALQAPLFDTATAAALGIGTTNASSITIGGATTTTTIQGPFVANGSQFTNNGSTVLTGVALSNFTVNGPIGAASSTVDVSTTFTIPQTTAGRTLNLPAPTTGTVGRLAYVLNTGSVAFTMHGVSIQANKAQTYIYDGSAWTATNIDGAGSGVTFVGTLDAQTKSSDGAVVSGNGIYLQTADSSNPGLVSAGVQTFAGDKTFSGLITGSAGAAVSGATISLNTSSNFDTNINTGTSTGAVSIGNSAAGNISLQSGSTIGVTGVTNINTTGSATTTIGNASAVNNLTGTNAILGATTINTTGTATTTIGSATSNTSIQGSLTVNPQTSTSTTLLCTNGGVVSTCDTSMLSPTAANFIQNGTTLQASSNFYISGDGRADTSFLAPSFDRATAGTLHIGTGANSTGITIGSASATNIDLYGGSVVVHEALKLQDTVSGDVALHINSTINSSDTSSVVGLQNQPRFNPMGGSLLNLYGSVNVPTITGSDYTIGNVHGGYNRFDTTAGYTGQITNGYGMRIGQPNLGGTPTGGVPKVTNYYGIEVEGVSGNGGNTSGTARNYGMRVRGSSAGAGAGGTVVNYGIRIDQSSGTGGNTSNYGLYLTGNGASSGTGVNYAIYNDSNAPNYIQGNTSIGTASNPNGYALNVANVLGVNTSSIQLGSTTTDTTAIFLGLDSFENGVDGSDPAGGYNGAMYYNTNLNKFRCYENGAWTDCVGVTDPAGFIQNSTTLQASSNFYISGTGRTDTAFVTPAIRAATDGTAAITIQDAAGTADIVTVDTSNSRVGIGSGIAAPTATLQVAGTLDSAGGEINLNDSSNFAVNIGTGTSTGNVTVGNGANTTNIESGAINIGTVGTGTTTMGNATGDTSITGGNLSLQGASSAVLSTASTSGDTGAIFIQTGASSAGMAGNILIDAGAGTASSSSTILNDTFEGCSVDDMGDWFGETIAGLNVGGLAHGGSCVLAVTETSGNGGFWGVQEAYNALSVIEGHQYSFSAWARATTLPQTINAQVHWNDGSVSVFGSAQTSTSGWVELSGSFIAPAGATNAFVSFQNGGGGNGSSVTYIDDIVVQTGLGAPAINIGTTNAKTIVLGNAAATTIVRGAFTAAGGEINLNDSSNFAVNIGTGTSTGNVTIGSAINTTTFGSNTINVGSAAADTTIQAAAQTSTDTAGAGLTIQGSTGSGTGAGGSVTIRGGNGGATNGDGGNLILSGGSSNGTGTLGLVTLNPTAFTGTSQSCAAANCSIIAATVDTNSTVLINNTYAGATVSMADPTITTAGRILYVTNSGTQDMILAVNGGGQGNTIALKPNTTATMFWNGVDWTAAGASSATDLQAAYNNTQSTAGGAEIILGPSGGQTDGLTIRNNGATPITGALFEVQSSIATNLFSVNNNTTEYAVNGGAEDSSFTNWTNYNGGVAAKTTTPNTYATGVAGVGVTTSGANQGAKNTLASALTAGTYVVSFAAKTTSGTNTFNAWFSSNGTAQTATCDSSLPGSGYAISQDFSVTTSWTKVSCFVTVPAGATANNAILIANQSNTNFYIDNLSVISNAATTTPANVQIGGGATGGQPTLFTLDQFAGPPMTTDNPAYYGSMYYDTTKNAIQCYQATSGWGACGSAPDDIISMTPEYTGAVLNGSGVGTMTADFCANQPSVLTVGTLCSSGEARNFYRWTSPQATTQSYNVYVTYRLPSTFKSFAAGTMSLTGLIDNTSNAAVQYAVFRKAQAGTISACSADTANIGTANTWTSISPTTDIASSDCGASGPTPFVAGDTMIIRITVSANSNANAYVENLTFRYSNK